MADVYVWKSKSVKNMQDYTQKKFGAWGFLLMDERMYLVSHCHVKKLLQNLSYFCSANIYIFFY